MGTLRPVSYLAIGHVTHDLLASGAHAVGGTVSYAALTAAALGHSVGMLTSAGEDFDFSVFNGSISVHVNPALHTTTFQNLYTNGTREQVVYGVAAPLCPGLVPGVWRAAPIVHVGPVMGECDADLVLTFESDTIVGITAQGWMRFQNGSGRVEPRAWHPGRTLLQRASAIVFSIDDIRGEWQQAEALAKETRILVVTMGAKGGVLFVGGTKVPFPALKVREADPTGAGDIFASTFFCKLASGVEPQTAARFSACVASRSVERRGIAGVPGPEDLAFCNSHLA